jgi:hypothetical protein
MPEKCYLKIQPSADAGEPCGGGFYTPYPGFADALKGDGAEYGPLSGATGCSTGVLYPVRPDCTLGATLHKFFIHYDYFMSRTGGSHNFSLRDVGIHSVHYGTYSPDIILYGGESEISGTVHYEVIKNNWDYLYPKWFKDSRRLRLYFGQGTDAYNCYGKLGDFYILVEFTPADDLIQTKEASIISDVAERGNGEILDNPEGNYTFRGFEYYKDGDSGNVLEAGENGDFGIGEYTKVMSGLDPDTKYYYRAKAENDIFTIYGEWLDFTTLKSTQMETLGAERSRVYARTILRGEIGEL